MKHHDHGLYDTDISLHIIIAKGLRKECHILNCNYYKITGVPQGIVCGHPCL